MQDTTGKSTIDGPLAHPVLERESLTKRLYTISELMRLTRISRKQTNYWERIGLIVPIFRNDQARAGQPAVYYSASEVVKAMIVCELRRAGFSLRQVQQIARHLEERGIQLFESEAFLLTDGYSVYYADNNNAVVDILKHHRQMLLLVPIHEHVVKLKEAA